MYKESTMKRRTFLKAASVAAFGAPFIVPSRVLGQNAPGNRFTLGVIGCGNMGNTNMRAFLKRPDVQVVAVCDLDRARRLEAKKAVEDHYAAQSGVGSYSGCDDYSDFRDIIGRADIDLVSIAVPDHWHSIPHHGGQREEGYLWRKTPCENIHEGRAIVEAVKRNNVIWQTGSWQRSQAHFHNACQLVRNGRIGDIKEIEVGLPTGKPIDPQRKCRCPTVSIMISGWDRRRGLPIRSSAATGISAGFSIIRRTAHRLGGAPL
jgi:threonine dehydrogenase-like Zn-dependent dehydrogenase